MPFELTRAPSTFQREMSKIVFHFIDVFSYVFIDDVLICSKNIKEQLIHIKQVLEVFKENKLKINIKKHHFLQTEVDCIRQMFLFYSKYIFIYLNILINCIYNYNQLNEFLL